MRRRATPPWWDWELEFTEHIELRMKERSFSQEDVRSMLQCSLVLRPSVAVDRFVVECRLRRERWELVLEPDYDRSRLVVVTAYRIG